MNNTCFSPENNNGETFESYFATLRFIIKSCSYCDRCIDFILCDRIVLSILDVKTQEMLLRKRDLTLAKATDICKTAETAVTQGKAYTPDVVNKVVYTTKQKILVPKTTTKS